MNALRIVLAWVCVSVSMVNRSVCSDRSPTPSERHSRRDVLGYGTLSLLQVALYGEAGEAQTCTEKESATLVPRFGLLDCGTSSRSATNSCSPDQTIGPDSVRSEGGTTSHCARAEVKHQAEWRPVRCYLTEQQGSPRVAFSQLVCKPNVSLEKGSSTQQRITSPCVGSAASECGTSFADTQSIWPDFNSPAVILMLLRVSIVVLLILLVLCIYLFQKACRDLDAIRKRIRWVRRLRPKPISLCQQRILRPQNRTLSLVQRPQNAPLSAAQRPQNALLSAAQSPQNAPLSAAQSPQNALSAAQRQQNAAQLFAAQRLQNRAISVAQRPPNAALSATQAPQGRTLSVAQRPQNRAPAVGVRPQNRALSSVAPKKYVYAVGSTLS